MSLLIALGLAGALLQSPSASTGATISGRIVEEGSGVPVAGAQVVLFPARPGPAALPFRDRPKTATTDPDGRYTFEDVEPGRYRISVQKTGYALHLVPGLPEIDLTAGERHETAEVRLQRGGVIAGRVLDESGEPVVNARVMAMQKAPVSAGMASGRGDVLIPAGGGGETNDLGEFRLFSLAPGEYYVHAMPRPHFDGAPVPRGTTMLPTYFPGTSESRAAQAVTVAAGQTSGDVVFRMSSVPAFAVSGTVLDDSGRPVENAVVRLDIADSAARSPFMMAMWNQARTDAAGRFTIPNVTNGTYTLVAMAPQVISGPAKGRGRATGAAAGGFAWGMTGGSITGGSVTGGSNDSMGGHVLTETNPDGTTVQYRDDAATRVPVTVQDGNVGGLEVVVRPPAR